MLRLHLDTDLGGDIDALTCAIALGWNEGVELSEIPLRLEIREGWLQQTVDERGTPKRVVTRVDGERFNEFWLHTVVQENAVAPVPRP